MSFLWFPLEHLPFIILVMLISFSVHEFAHAWTAWKFGDDTAYQQGRVTLNPRAHLDGFGFLLLILAGFGWARPVPVRASRFRHPRVMSVLVTAAGPVSNLILVFIGQLIVYLLVLNNVQMSHAMTETLRVFFAYLITVNVNLFLFNLIPLPPLDGYRIVEQFMPLGARIKMVQYEQWTFFLFLLIVFVPPLRAMTLDPLFSLQLPILRGINNLLASVLGTPS